MTRINIGVKPSELTDKHLLAEHREIVRIPNTVYSGRAKIVDKQIKDCCLGRQNKCHGYKFKYK